MSPNKKKGAAADEADVPLPPPMRRGESQSSSVQTPPPSGRPALDTSIDAAARRAMDADAQVGTDDLARGKLAAVDSGETKPQIINPLSPEQKNRSPASSSRQSVRRTSPSVARTSSADADKALHRLGEQMPAIPTALTAMAEGSSTSPSSGQHPTPADAAAGAQNGIVPGFNVTPVGAFAYSNSMAEPDLRPLKGDPGSSIPMHYPGQHPQEEPSSDARAIVRMAPAPPPSPTPVSGGMPAAVIAAQVVNTSDDAYELENRLRQEFQEETRRITQQVRKTLLAEAAVGEVIAQAETPQPSRPRPTRPSRNSTNVKSADVDDRIVDDDSDTGKRKRSRLTWIVIFIVLLAVAAGVGIGIAVFGSGDSGGASNSQNGELEPTPAPAPSADVIDATSTQPVMESRTEIEVEYAVVVKDANINSLDQSVYVPVLIASMDLLAPQVLQEVIGKPSPTSDGGVRLRYRHLEPHQRQLAESLDLPTRITNVGGMACPYQQGTTPNDRCESITATMEVLGADPLSIVPARLLGAIDDAITDGRLQLAFEQVVDLPRVSILGSLMTKAPTLAPTEDRFRTPSPTSTDFNRMRDLLFPLSGTLLDDPSTHQFSALFWLAHGDPGKKPVDTYPVEELRSRYVAALLYFVLEGVGWNDGANFLTAGHICDWNKPPSSQRDTIGIICSVDTVVEKVNLNGNRLKGAIPTEIQYFTELRELNLGNNGIDEGIPTHLSAMQDLMVLDLANNAFTGTIPQAIASLPNLVQLILRGNMLSGSIPSFHNNSGTIANIDMEDNIHEEGRLHGNLSEILESIPPGNLESFRCSECVFADQDLPGPSITRFAHLRIFDIYNTGVGGVIPPVLGTLQALQELDLRSNKLHGPIPDEIGLGLALERILFSDNGLTGSLPQSVASIQTLVSLEVSHNKMNGTIPSFANNGGKLQMVDLRRVQDNNEFHFDVEEFFRDVSGEDFHTIFCHECFLKGTMPSTDLERFTRLEIMNLDDSKQNQNGGIDGPFPTEIGLLTNLQILGLHCNRLEGGLPRTIENLELIRRISLGGNKLNGKIPTEINQLKNLQKLEMWGNDLSGTIPTFSGTANSSSLLAINLNRNFRLSGDIEILLDMMPCENLQRFDCRSCHLTGSLPTTIGRCKKLSSLVVSGNDIEGPIPSQIGELTRLVDLILTNNHVNGSLPTEIGNLQNLETLVLNTNNMNGVLPQSLGDLPNLRELVMYNNHLIGPIPSFAKNAQAITTIDLANNMALWADVDTIFTTTPTEKLEVFLCGSCALRGSLPPAIGGYSKLRRLNIDDTKVEGVIPTEIGMLESLTEFEASSCLLRGKIPTQVSQLQQLEFLNLGGNSLSGVIPSKIGDLQNLRSLILRNNDDISGSLPSFANAKELHSLDLNSLNGLTVGLHAFFATLTKDLGEFKCRECIINSAMPATVGRFKSMTTLELSSAGLVGEIPTEVGDMQLLSVLDLDSNNLEGQIPEDVGNLKNLKELYLASNKLSGTFPAFFSDNDGRLEVLSLNWNDSPFSQTLESVLDTTKLPTSLRVFECRWCGLSGMLPDEIREYTNLEGLELTGNGLRGAVPSSLGMLLKLTSLTLDKNDLTGSIPGPFCQQTFEHLDADCGDHPPQVSCHCCTQCWSDASSAYV